MRIKIQIWLSEPRFFSAIMVAAREAMKENVKDAMRTFALMDEQ